jgi:hypothetical protein
MFKMSKLLKNLLAFALPMYVMDGDGGGAALNTDNFAEMLGGDDDNGQTEQSDPQNADDAQETVTETDQEGTDDAQEGDDKAETDPDGQPETDPNDAFLELEINGEKVTVSKDEAKNGYLRQQDYTQKTQALAAEKQATQQHIMKQFAEVQQMSQEIGQLTNIDAQLKEYGNVDWQTLRNDDPTAYAVHQAEFNNLRIARGEVVNGIGAKQAQFAQLQAEQFAAQSAEAKAHMETIVPGFGKEHIAQMKDAGTKAGFRPEELAQLSDKRMMEVLYKAAQYDALKAKTEKSVKTVAALPTKAAKAAPVAKPAQQKNIETQSRRLAQTGSVKDFAALLGMS